MAQTRDRIAVRPQQRRHPTLEERPAFGRRRRVELALCRADHAGINPVELGMLALFHAQPGLESRQQPRQLRVGQDVLANPHIEVDMQGPGPPRCGVD
jgi:hypothetical protein